MMSNYILDIYVKYTDINEVYECIPSKYSGENGITCFQR